MTPETITWLSKRMQQIGESNIAGGTAVNDFAMLWSFFECTKLSCSASFTELGGYVADNLDVADEQQVDAYIKYLQKLYVENGQFTQEFHALHFPYTPREVDEALKGEAASLQVKMTACMMILSRYRHNLFHGEKWKEGLQGQQETFLHASEFLKSLMR